MRKLKFDLDVNSNALLCPNPMEFYSKAYLTENVANNFRTIPGIKESTKLARNTFSNVLNAAGCAWAATDSVLDAVDIDVCKLDAMVQICQYDLESSFVSLKMAKGDTNWVEAEFMKHYYDELSKEIEAEIQDLRWNGNTAIPLSANTYLSNCDGYIVKLTGSTATSVSGAAISTANIISAITSATTALPEAVKGKKADMRIYMSAGNALKYQIATNGYNHNLNYTGELPLNFAGYEISVQEGMNDKYIVVGNKNNFVYAFDGEGDSKVIKSVNMTETTAEPIIRTRVGLKVGFHILNAGEIAYYKGA